MLCGSTAFLIGPAQQIRMMFDPVRMYATTIYIGCVVLALICALLVSFWILWFAQQIKMIFEPVRMYASAIYAGSIFISFIPRMCCFGMFMNLLNCIFIEERSGLLWFAILIISIAGRAICSVPSNNKILKQFNFKGKTTEFKNTYYSLHFK